jgi:hypothetical protein
MKVSCNSPSSRAAATAHAHKVHLYRTVTLVLGGSERLGCTSEYENLGVEEEMQ